MRMARVLVGKHQRRVDLRGAKSMCLSLSSIKLAAVAMFNLILGLGPLAGGE